MTTSFHKMKSNKEYIIYTLLKRIFPRNNVDQGLL